MLVAGVRTFGGKVETFEVDEPRPLAADEVLIDVRSAGIGNWDNIIRTGGWDARSISVTAVYVRSDGAQLDRLTALLASRRLSMPTPRSCSLDQAGSALAQVVAGHESSGVVITKDI